MGMKQKEVGGGPATGLANDFVGFLQKGLQTGSFGSAGATSQFAGANPYGSTTGVGGLINDIIAGPAGTLGGSMQQLISTQQANDVAALRSRFGAGGGTSFGTPAAYAESTYRAQAAPQIATAIGGLQENLLSQLLPLYAGLSQRGISQREVVSQPSTGASIAQIGLPLAGSILGAFGGNPALGSGLGSLFAKLFGGGGNVIPNIPSAGDMGIHPSIQYGMLM